MKLSFIIVVLFSFCYISNGSQYCLNCPKGTIWNKDTRQCFKLSKSNNVKNRFSHCLVSDDELNCLVCEQGYYKDYDHTFTDYSQCQKNPQKGDEYYIENCLEYDHLNNCKKCTAPLTYYRETNQCIDPTTLIDNCYWVQYSNRYKQNQCLECQPGYHKNSFISGCFADPQPGQKGYIQNCERYYDWGSNGQPVYYKYPRYSCVECDLGYEYNDKTKLCEKLPTVAHCTGRHRLWTDKCGDCEDDYYLTRSYQCDQCDYQVQNLINDNQQLNRVSKFLQKMINNNN